MNKTTKGAFAASAAAVLLLGGAGSLAYWTDAETLDGGDVTAGNLSLDPHTCDADWTYAAGNAGAGDTVVRFVPGDVITKDCTFVVRGAGDNLEATLTTPSTYAIGAGDVTAEVAASYTVGATAVTGNSAQITSADNGKTVTATLTVTFPYGTDEDGTVNTNSSQGDTAVLNDITVNLTQNNPN